MCLLWEEEEEEGVVWTVGSWSRRGGRWVGRARWQAWKADFETVAVWKIEAGCAFECGLKCGLFAESVTGSVVMGAHL